jgi:hypothetical protein
MLPSTLAQRWCWLVFTMAEVAIEPDAFDCVVLGTGLPESLIAGCVRTRGPQPSADLPGRNPNR